MSSNNFLKIGQIEPMNPVFPNGYKIDHTFIDETHEFFEAYTWNKKEKEHMDMLKNIKVEFDGIPYQVINATLEHDCSEAERLNVECVKKVLEPKVNINNYADSMWKVYKNLLCGHYDDKKKPEFGVPKIENVIFNPPATVVFWKDGTKTIVQAINEEFDPEKGLAMAITKKALGNKHSYYDTIKKWLKKGQKFTKYVKAPMPEDAVIEEASDQLTDIVVKAIERANKTKVKTGVK